MCFHSCTLPAVHYCLTDSVITDAHFSPLSSISTPCHVQKPTLDAPGPKCFSWDRTGIAYRVELRAYPAVCLGILSYGPPLGLRRPLLKDFNKLYVRFQYKTKYATRGGLLTVGWIGLNFTTPLSEVCLLWSSCTTVCWSTALYRTTALLCLWNSNSIVDQRRCMRGWSLPGNVLRNFVGSPRQVGILVTLFHLPQLFMLYWRFNLPSHALMNLES